MIQSTEDFLNSESPFTELFTLLKRYENSPNGNFTLAYCSEELQLMYQHITNAIEILLQGLQGLGYLMGLVSANNTIKNLDHIGYFISAVGNLTEALNNLRLDTSYVLRERGVINY